MRAYHPGLGEYPQESSPPFVRRATPEDVLGCIARFTKSEGHPPAAVIICSVLNGPAFLKLGDELAGQGIELTWQGGILAWEVWVRGGVPDQPGTSNTETQGAPRQGVELSQNSGAVLDTTPPLGQPEKGPHAGGRPPVSIPAGVLAGPGSLRKKARAAGVSKSTIARLQGRLEGL